jgi:hypothetical protein
MTRRPYINNGATLTEDLVMDVDTPLVRAGSSPAHQSDEELYRAEPMAMDQLDGDTRHVSAGSSQTAQGEEELDRAEQMTMDHFDNNTPLVRAGSSTTDQSDEELDRAEPIAVDGDTRLVSAGSSQTAQGDEVVDGVEANLRLELLTNIFATEPVQLKDFKEPPECFQNQHQGAEIFSRYLFHTYFLVKVWISFDADEEVFFEGARSEACGRLRLPEAVYQDLATSDPGIIKLQEVCLEIGTPFRTPATIDLTVEHNDDHHRLRARGKMLPGHDDKRRLVDYMRYCVKRITHIGLADGVDGITLNDLEFFASLFRRDRETSPGRNEDWEEPAWEGGEWAGEEEPSQFRWHFTRNITG